MVSSSIEICSEPLGVRHCLGNEFTGAGLGALRVLAGGLPCAEHSVAMLTRVTATLNIRHAVPAL